MSNLNKLRWRCRRGTLELDLMLVRYLDRCFIDASDADRETFIALLDYEDSDLLRFMLGEHICADSRSQNLIEQIRRLPV